MPDPDDPSATLAGIRAIEQAATPGPWRPIRGIWGEGETFPAVITSHGDPARAETWLMAAGRGSPDPESNVEFAAMARTMFPVLLAVIEKMLEAADGWAAEAKRIGGIFAGEEDPWPRTVGGMRAEAFESCAKTVCEAITTALTGKETARD